jgi:hypothetical protein
MTGMSGVGVEPGEADVDVDGGVGADVSVGGGTVIGVPVGAGEVISVAVTVSVT